MSSIAVTASATGTGVVSLVAPVTNTNRTLTLPDATGTVLAGTASASVLNAVTNKIAIQNNVITIKAENMGNDNSYNPGF
jgi:hypothetical protein